MKCWWASTIPGVITGQTHSPRRLGGEGRRDGPGGIYVVREAAKVLGIDLKGKTMAIQGFGNAGQFAALLGAGDPRFEAGGRLRLQGGDLQPEGARSQAGGGLQAEDGRAPGISGSRGHYRTKICWRLDVTVLFPSALENVITDGQCGQNQVPDLLRAGQRPDDARGGRDPLPQQRLRPPRFPGQRRRGHGLLFRAGAEHLQLLLALGGGAPAPGRKDDAGRFTASTRCTCGKR